MELIKVENITPIELFTKDGVDPLLAKITEEVKKFVPDISTKKGRDDVASMAHKVAKTKVYLDDLGKDLVSDWKAKSKIVDDSRKKIRDYLDALKDEVRAPLTNWETAEKSRVARLNTHIEWISRFKTFTADLSAESLENAIHDLKDFTVDDQMEEFEALAHREKESSLKHLEETLAKRKKSDADQAELNRLREEQAQREKEDREKKIAEEATRKANEEAEREKKRLQDEKELAIRRQAETEQKLKDEQERAIKVAQKAEEDKKRAAQEAAEAERKRIEDQKKKEAEEQAKREASIKHRKKINNEALDALVTKVGLDTHFAKKVIEAVAKGEVPHMKILY